MTPDMPILDGAVADTALEYARALREQADAVEQVASIRRGITAAFVARDPSLYFFMLPYYDAQRRYTDARERVRRSEERFVDACNELVYGSADFVREGGG